MSLIHTVVRDLEENLYYSDELNHTVTSLDRRGNLRWIRPASGKETVKYRYPRGLSLGWHRSGGRYHRCLAVTDAWNHRVHLLSLDGRDLAVWETAGSPLLEPSDIRYVASPGPAGDPGPDGRWLVLEKGNHRISVFGTEGTALYQIGRCLHPSLADPGVPPSMLMAREVMLPPEKADYPRIDFLYYPSALLGHAETALFVAEPLSRTLKQIINGNLFPISFHPPVSADWIDGSDSYLLGYSRRERALHRYDRSGRLERRSEIDGAPAHSDLPGDQFWICTGNELQRWSWEAEKGTDDGGGEAGHGAYALLKQTAIDEIDRIDAGESDRIIAELMANFEAGFQLVDDLLSKARTGHLLEEDWVRACARQREIMTAHVELDSRLRRALDGWSLAFLELRATVSGEPDDPAADGIVRAREAWSKLILPIREKFVDLEARRRIDEIYFHHSSLNDRYRDDPRLLDSLNAMMVSVETDLGGIRDWLYQWGGIQAWIRLWSGTPPGSDEADRTSGVEMEAASAPAPQAEAPRPRLSAAPRSQGEPTGIFRAEQRLSLVRYCTLPQPQPCCLAVSPKGEIFVSLFAEHQILHLDAEGKLIARIGRHGDGPGELNGPAGLALDVEDRLWVVDCLNRRIQILDSRGKTAQIIAPFRCALGQFEPMGTICALPDGSVAAADSGNLGMVRISPAGTCRVFSEDPKLQAEGIRRPTSLWCTPSADIWCTDYRNHRIHLVDQAGRIVRSIGGFGIEPGRLVHPTSLAVLEDGLIAAVQNELIHCVKLLRASGEEVGRVQVDFNMGHVSLLGRRLLVTDWYGDSIRVYERLPVFGTGS